MIIIPDFGGPVVMATRIDLNLPNLAKDLASSSVAREVVFCQRLELGKRTG